jgi:hypothetical protein
MCEDLREDVVLLFTLSEDVVLLFTLTIDIPRHFVGPVSSVDHNLHRHRSRASGGLRAAGGERASELRG